MQKFLSRVGAPLFLALLVSFFAWYLRFNAPIVPVNNFLENSELRLLDSRFLLRGPQSKAELDKIGQQLAVVTIDDRALNRFGNGGPIPREIQARLVRSLKKAGAKVIIFDVLFVDANLKEPAQDRALAAEIGAARNVFLPFDHNTTQITPPAQWSLITKKLALPIGAPQTAQRVRLQMPVAPLFAMMHGGGHVATKADNDAKFRSAILLLESKNVFPQAVLSAVAQGCWKLKNSDFRLENDFLHVGNHVFGPLKQAVLQRTFNQNGAVISERVGTAWTLPLNFAGGSEIMARFSIPFEDALEGRADARLKNRVVIIGESATGTTDLRPSPFDGRETFLGVQTNATLIANLLNDNFLRAASPLANFGATLVCGLLASLLVLALRPALAFFANLALVFAFGWLAVRVFSTQNLVLETTAPLLAILLCFVSLGTYRLAGSDRSARENARALRETQQLLGQIVNPKLALELANSPEARLNLQIGARREISVLFCDIRGFTPWSETQTPEAVKGRLDEYFPIMCEICEDDYDGFIDKFIGDAMMVVWNAHKDHPDHAKRAILATLSMHRALKMLNEGWAKQNVAPFQIGIGIASGPAIFGTFGAPGRKVAPTVLGDTVNIAARLEGQSKEFGPIVISQKTVEELGDKSAWEKDFSIRFVGNVPIKGKSETQAIYVVEKLAV